MRKATRRHSSCCRAARGPRRSLDQIAASVVIGKEPGIKLAGDRVDCDWKQDKAYEYMKTGLRVNPKIDVVYAHNDPMAYGAYLAAKDAGRDKAIRFVGIDGLPQESATWVEQWLLA